MSLFEEVLLEPLARYFRFKKASRYIGKQRPLIILDLGCGSRIAFYYFCLKYRIHIKKYIGIDPLIKSSLLQKFKFRKDMSLIKVSLKKKLFLPENSVDYIIGLAFLEHIDYPEFILPECLRVLKKGGRAIFTTPTPKAKFLLEFLSFKLGVISKREIAQHKNYFDKKCLQSFISHHKSFKVSHHYFEFKMNNLLVIEKLK